MYLAFASERIDSLPCFEECILQQVVGIFVRKYHLAYVPIYRLREHFDDTRKGLLSQRFVFELQGEAV